MMRQGANSAVRFTTYTTLKQFVQGNARPGQTIPSSITFAIGAVAGLVTVYTTMPLEYVSVLSPISIIIAPFFAFFNPPRYRYPVKNELKTDHLMCSVIKTRMQSLDARAQYRNSFHCAYRIFTEEGVLRFWTGTTPRLARLIVSVFLIDTFMILISDHFIFYLLSTILLCILLSLTVEWWDSIYCLREDHWCHWGKRRERNLEHE